MLPPFLPPGSPVSGTWLAPLLQAPSLFASRAILQHQTPVSIPGAAAAAASPSLKPGSSSVQPAQLGSGKHSTSCKGSGGDRRYVEAAGRLPPTHMCGNAFSGCLTFREQEEGAGVGRELLGANHPHCAHCFGLKKKSTAAY